MKHYLLLLAAMLGLTLSACSDSGVDTTEEPTPELPSPSISLILGEVTENSISLEYSTTNADKAALIALRAEKGAPTAEQVLSEGRELIIGEGLQSLTIEELAAATEYVIYAAAMNEKEAVLRSISATTLEEEPEKPVLPAAEHISLVETTNQSFSYAVEVESGVSYMHTYLEGWLFEYLLAQRYMTDGAEFEMDVFLKQCLIDFGFVATDSSNYTWAAGDPNDYRSPYFATIVGGQPYYVLFAPSNPEGSDFWGTAEVLHLTTEPAGESMDSLTLKTEQLTAENIVIRMEAARSVEFFFYELWTTESVENMKAKSGIEGMKQALIEYGWAVQNTYTDSWGVNPDTSYTLCILGIDTSGDLFYQEQEYTSLELVPHVEVTLRPYERELNGYHAYDTFELTVVPYNFYEQVLDPATMRYLFAPQSEVTEALASAGLSLEEYAANPTNEGTAALDVMLRNLPALEQDMISNYGYISNLLTNLEPAGEYCYMMLVPWREGYKVGYAVHATEAQYGGDEPTDAYKAYLGEWIVAGQSSEDYYTRASYTIRFEELVSNRGYKVYGWSASDIAEEFPFEARFHPETGKISIESIQQLGVKEIEGYEYQVLLTGMTSAGGYLSPHGGFSGIIYEGRCDGTHLSMFPGMFSYGGYQFNFNSLAYSAYYGGEFYAFEGDEYPLVNFSVDRSTTPAIAARHHAGAVARRTGAAKSTPNLLLQPLR